MALYVKQDETRSQLQTKIAADLQQRLKDDKKIEAPKVDPVFYDDKVQTKGYGFILLLLAIIAVVMAVYFLRP